MRELKEPIEQTMDASAVPASWNDVLERVRRDKGRVVVEQDGVPVAAIVSADDLEWLSQLDARRRAGLRLLKESQAAFAGEPPERIEAEIAKAITAVRARERRKLARSRVS